jgi:hypothetical protein
VSSHNNRRNNGPSSYYVSYSLSHIIFYRFSISALLYGPIGAYLNYRASNTKTAREHELQRTWEEVVVAEMRNDPGICLVGLRITTENLAQYCGVPAKIRTVHLPNKSLERCR